MGGETHWTGDYDGTIRRKNGHGTWHGRRTGNGPYENDMGKTWREDQEDGYVADAWGEDYDEGSMDQAPAAQDRHNEDNQDSNGQDVMFDFLFPDGIFYLFY